MNVKNRWLYGLQWGACLWLPYVLRDAAQDFYYAGLSHLPEGWPRLWWTPFYVLIFPGWLAAVALLVAGSRRARLAVTMMVLARIAVAAVETHAMQMPDGGAQYIVPLFLPLLPLVVLRVEEPRVVLALAALGRWREALARSGGVVALLVALAVLSTHLSAREAVWGSPVSDAFRLPAMLAGLAFVVTWATRQRAPTRA